MIQQVTAEIRIFGNEASHLMGGFNACVLTQILRPMRSFDAALRTALEFISNPHKLWESGRLCDRRAVLRLAFPGGFQYHRNTGLRTAETPLPFKVLGAIASKKIQLAEKALPYPGITPYHLRPHSLINQ